MDKLKCSVSGCDFTPTRLIKGLCTRHYERQRKTGSIGVATRISDSWGSCVISQCKDKAGPTGACRKHWHKVNSPLKSRKRNLKNKGLTLDQYQELLTKQEGCCKVCGAKEPGHKRKNFAVDHDHSCCSSVDYTCGKCFRGLLCTRCNLVLGEVQDDPILLFKMIKYLNQEKNDL